MKPLGLFLAIFDTPHRPAGVDADYDWHVRHAEADRRATESAGRARRAPITERLVGLARRSLARTASQSARRA